ncbi:MAG: hypothetical protein ACK4TP_17370 [Hyphomicrobium sp.]|jgi:hypothetical protein
MAIASIYARGRRHWPVAALFILAIAAPAAAQRVAPEVPKVPGGIGTGGGAGVGGGAGLAPPMPTLRSSPMAVPAAPQVTPAAPAAPAAPAPIIRFRCEVPQGESTCKEPAPADGGGDDSCDCAKDFCYKDAAGTRICEKS